MATVRINISSQTLGDIDVIQQVPFGRLDSSSERREVFAALAQAVEQIAGAYGIGMKLTGESVTAARINPTDKPHPSSTVSSVRS